MPSTLTAKTQQTPKATPKTVYIDELNDFIGTPPRSWIDGAAKNIDATEMLSLAEQPVNALFPPEAFVQRRQREYGKLPKFVLDGPTLINDGVISFKPGPGETLAKRSSGKTLVDGRSETVRKSNINEATGSLQLSSGWLPNEVANFQSMSDESDVPKYSLSSEAEPFVPGQKSMVHQSSRRRRNVKVDADEALLGVRKLRLIMF